jgi:inositol-phosphate transport system substrate-binding protein
MKKFLFAIIFILIYSIISASGYAETIKIVAWTIGPDTASIGRKTSLEKAAVRLNKDLESEGANVRIDFKIDHNTTTWASFNQRNLMALQTKDPNKIPDIIITGNEHIGPYGAAGYIEPLDNYLAKHKEFKDNFFPHLWKGVYWNGKIWGIPRDATARGAYIRKDVLKKIGWSREDIDGLKERVFQGEFTLDDIANLAKKIKDSKIVETPMTHRPTPGTDWFAFIWNFGGRIIDPPSGKLVITKSATLEAFNYLDKLVNKLNVVPSSMTNWRWPEILEAIVTAKSAIHLTGGNWNWGAFQLPPYSLKEDFMFDNIMYVPIPAGKKGGKPVSVSHEMITLLTSTSRNKDLAFRLITYSYADDLLAESHLMGGYVAITKSEMQMPNYKASRWLSELSEFIPHMRQVPIHIKAPFYWESLFQAIQAVETGSKKPEAALEFLVKRMKLELGDQLIVEE